MGSCMDTLDVRGIPLEVHQMGSGPPLLFLHAEQFFAQSVPNLEALAAKWRVIAPRHPGFGGIERHADIRTVDDLAYLYLDLMDQLALTDVTLVGASFGGWVGLEMAVRNCARLKRLVLASSVGVKFSGREERDFADLFYLSDSDAFPVLFADPKKWAPSYPSMPAADVQAIARERQMTAFYAWKPYMHNPGLRRWLHRVTVPALVLWGEQDRFAAPAYARKLTESLPNAELKLIAGAGHFPQIEQSSAVVSAIEAFAKR